MKRQIETETEFQPELQLENSAGAESMPKLLDAPDLQDAPEFPTTNDAGLLAPMDADVSSTEWDAARTQMARLQKSRLLWVHRQLILYWAVAGFCVAVLVAIVIPKQYVSVARLMPPDAQSASKLALQELTGGFGSIAGGLLGDRSSGALFVAMMRSRVVEDRIIDRFNLRQVYRIEIEENVRARLEQKTSISLEPKTGIIVLSFTDGDPRRAAAIASAYVQELEALVAQLNTSSAHRERVFLQGQLQTVKIEMETAEKDFSEFDSKNGAMDITEQGRVMIESGAEIQGQIFAAESQLAELRQTYTNGNARVRSLQARISELINQKKRLLGTYSGKSFAEAEIFDRSFPTFRQLPILAVPYETKIQKLKMEEAVYETLRAEFESARMQEARENPSVEVLDLPEVPERKSFPPRLLVVVTGTGCAVIFSGVWILGAARWREIGAHPPEKVLAHEILGSTATAIGNLTRAQ